MWICSNSFFAKFIKSTLFPFYQLENISASGFISNRLEIYVRAIPFVTNPQVYEKISNYMISTDTPLNPTLWSFLLVTEWTHWNFLKPWLLCTYPRFSTLLYFYSIPLTYLFSNLSCFIHCIFPYEFRCPGFTVNKEILEWFLNTLH